MLSHIANLKRNTHSENVVDEPGPVGYVPATFFDIVDQPASGANSPATARVAPESAGEGCAGVRCLLGDARRLTTSSTLTTGGTPTRQVSSAFQQLAPVTRSHAAPAGRAPAHGEPAATIADVPKDGSEGRRAQVARDDFSGGRGTRKGSLVERGATSVRTPPARLSSAPARGEREGCGLSAAQPPTCTWSLSSGIG